MSFNVNQPLHQPSPPPARKIKVLNALYQECALEFHLEIIIIIIIIIYLFVYF
jgi:hypothetical protein